MRSAQCTPIDSHVAARHWLVAGDADRDEFRELLGPLHAQASVTRCASVADAMDWLAASQHAADWILLVQSRPREFTTADIVALNRRAPLARVVLLVGPWCDGELRTGSPPAGVVRVAWHRWQAAWAEQQRSCERGQCPSWALPATVTDEERVLAELGGASDRCARRGLAIIVSSCAEMAHMLADACARCGMNAVTARADTPPIATPPAVLIWDVPDGGDAALHAALRRWTDRWSVPALVLVNFARPEHHAAWRSSGATAIMRKPLLLDELLRQLADALASERSCL
ncbi:MAG TPA: hypothetical protein VHZ24_10795 [Pirellulales bacterium]|jgi:CheY-like chemotaxis protein|nr:hypothetical protein [Pirellulales bacterium]